MNRHLIQARRKKFARIEAGYMKMFHIRYVDKLILLIEEFMHCRQSFSFNVEGTQCRISSGRKEAFASITLSISVPRLHSDF